jgi:hypothetical protein
LLPDRWTRKSRILFSMVDSSEVPLQVEDIRVVCHCPMCSLLSFQVFHLSMMQFLKLS